MKDHAEIREAVSKVKALLAQAIHGEGPPPPELGNPSNLLFVAATRDLAFVCTLEAVLGSLPEGGIRDNFRDALLVILQDRILHYRRCAHRVCEDFSLEQRQRWPHLFAERVDP